MRIKLLVGAREGEKELNLGLGRERGRCLSEGCVVGTGKSLLPANGNPVLYARVCGSAKFDT